MIHAKLHQRVALLEKELRNAKANKRPADFSTDFTKLRQSSISRFF